MIKIYLWIVLLLAYIGGAFGLLLPWMFSARSTEAVLMGILILIITPFIIYPLAKNIFSGISCELKKLDEASKKENE